MEINPRKFGKGAYRRDNSWRGRRYQTVNNNGRKDANSRGKKKIEPSSNKPKKTGRESARLIETIEVTFKDAFSHWGRGPARLPITANSFRAVGFICERGILGSWTNSCRWWSSRTWGCGGRRSVKLGLKVIFNFFSVA